MKERQKLNLKCSEKMYVNIWEMEDYYLHKTKVSVYMKVQACENYKWEGLRPLHFCIRNVQMWHGILQCHNI